MKLLFQPLLLITASCFSQNLTPPDTFEIITNEDGIAFEKFDSSNKDENRFNYDNTIFRKGVNYYYAYKHITPSGENLLFEYIDSTQLWEFVSDDPRSQNAILEIRISLKDGQSPFNRIDPDYYQSVIEYTYLTKDGPSRFGESTGVIENERNLWMHPPRQHYFNILELNPFPYVKLPYQQGEEWTWKLSIGDIWADPRWKTWNGLIENSYTYQTYGKEVLETALGALECIVVKSMAKSSLGTTRLTSWFHSEYGFVKLVYSNIDESKTILELLRVNQSVQ